MNRLITLLLLLPALTSADPGEVTRYLLNEPASLIDIGILRAELAMQGVEREIDNRLPYSFDLHEGGARHGETNVKLSSIIVSYDFEDDLILFEAELRMTGVADTAIAETECRGVIDRMSATVSVYSPYWFDHVGYIRSKRPDDFRDKLSKRIQLQCNAGKGGFARDPQITVKQILADYDEYAVIERDPK